MDLSLQSDTGDIEGDNTIYYVAGYICRKFLQLHKCSICENILIQKDDERVLSENHQIFAYIKAFDTDFGGLTLPRTSTFNQFRVWENTFCAYFLHNFQKRDILPVMREIMPSTQYFSLCSADQFQELVKLYLRIRLQWSVRFLNRIDQCNFADMRKLRILQHN